MYDELGALFERSNADLFPEGDSRVPFQDEQDGEFVIKLEDLRVRQN